MQLYIVDYPRKSEYAEAAIIKVERDYDRCDYCPECGARVSGAYWKQPREVVLTRHKAPDFLYGYSDNAPFVVSERVLDAMRSTGLTGLLKAEEIETVRFQRKSNFEEIRRMLMSTKENHRKYCSRDAFLPGEHICYAE